MEEKVKILVSKRGQIVKNEKTSLVSDTIDKQDVDHLIDWLKTYPRLTKGPITIELEEKWSKKIGTSHSVFCNSGSSANLLMLSALLEANRTSVSLINDSPVPNISYVKPGAKVVVPALAWATDLAPVIQLGFEPVICDVNLEDLSVDLKHLEEIFLKEKPAILILVSVLGLVPEMEKIKLLCDEHGVILLEDACESSGSQYAGQNLGTFGLMSSFSTYFGHHISTIEGGFVSTNNRTLYNVLKAVRSHGWDRDLDQDAKRSLSDKWGVDEFNALYTFYYPGYNLRSTDLQAKIGLRQIDKLGKVGEIRNKNFHLYNKYIQNDFWMPKQRENTFVSNFAYPVIHPNRKIMVEKLQRNNVEVRPLICGSMGKQPFYIERYGQTTCKNADVVDEYGFYIPNHPDLTEEKIKMISSIIMECIK